jgi:ubiquinone/menaquinone biosynthesis C-methylase UbiE
MKEYYDRRAPEYDATTYELFRASGEAPDLDALEWLVQSLPGRRILDIACGTGWLTRLLRGDVVGVDQSEAMLAIARRRMPAAHFVRVDVPPLPFSADSFDLAFAAHIYSHIEAESKRRDFVDEALRVASRLVLVEQAWRPGLEEETWEERLLGDGSRHRVFKRYYTAERLAAEHGGVVELDTASFVAASVTR